MIGRVQLVAARINADPVHAEALDGSQRIEPSPWGSATAVGPGGRSPTHTGKPRSRPASQLSLGEEHSGQRDCGCRRNGVADEDVLHG